jgi:hypothetical protein
MSPFESACSFGFINNLTNCLSQPANKFCLDSAILSHTSSWIFEQVHSQLTFIQNSNCKILSPDQFAAPAATIQTFVNSAIGMHLPSHDCWVWANADNSMCQQLLDLVNNSGKIYKDTLRVLQLNCHVHSGRNHNPMMVDRINRYLNKGLKIMTNKCGSVRIAMEDILLLIYAWNSAPIPGTDLSCSFVVVGREF